MPTRRNLKVLLLFLVIPSLASSQKYANPDAPATQAAARADLPNAHVVDIVGVTSGIKSVLQDLGARVIGQQIVIDLDADVLFDFDKYTLRPEATDTLRKLGQVVAGYPKSPLLIEGYTDSKGEHAYNMKLSDNRANTVKNWLIQNAGVQAGRITTRGWGETKPVAPNKNPDGSDNPAGRQKNRRVQIVLSTA